MLFDVQVTTRDSAEVISVIGDVDLATLPRMAAALDGATAEVVEVDLRSVDWFDPLCLGVLIAADLRVRRRGGALVVRADGQVADMLAESRVDTVLTVQV